MNFVAHGSPTYDATKLNPRVAEAGVNGVKSGSQSRGFSF